MEVKGEISGKNCIGFKGRTEDYFKIKEIYENENCE